MYTVVARFHHGSRDLDEIERTLEAAGATSAAITRFTVVMTFEEEESRDATKRARKNQALSCWHSAASAKL